MPSNSVFGVALGMSAPKVDLSGKNLVYFDTENGQLVHSDMDLDFGLDIGNALGEAGDLIGGLAASVGDLVGDLPEFQDAFPKGQTKSTKDLLNLDLDIKATMSLMDPLAGNKTGARKPVR